VRRWCWYTAPCAERRIPLHSLLLAGVDDHLLPTWRVHEFNRGERMHLTADRYRVRGIAGYGVSDYNIGRRRASDGDQGRWVVYLDLPLSLTICHGLMTHSGCLALDLFYEIPHHLPLSPLLSRPTNISCPVNRSLLIFIFKLHL